MKKYFSIFAILCAFFLVAPSANAIDFSDDVSMQTVTKTPYAPESYDQYDSSTWFAAEKIDGSNGVILSNATDETQRFILQGTGAWLNDNMVVDVEAGTSLTIAIQNPNDDDSGINDSYDFNVIVEDQPTEWTVLSLAGVGRMPLEYGDVLVTEGIVGYEQMEVQVDPECEGECETEMVDNPEAPIYGAVPLSVSPGEYMYETRDTNPEVYGIDTPGGDGILTGEGRSRIDQNETRLNAVTGEITGSGNMGPTRIDNNESEIFNTADEDEDGLTDGNGERDSRIDINEENIQALNRGLNTQAQNAAQFEAYVQQELNKIMDVNERQDAALAGAAALANLQFDPTNPAFQLAVSWGTYSGENAYAFGASKRLGSNIAVNASAGYTTQSEWICGAGLTLSF